MKNNLIYLLILGSLFLPVRLFCQQDKQYFEHFTIDEGLAENKVRKIFKDSLGILWFGTINGLTKYDGYNFTNYRLDPLDSTSLGDNTINSIVEAGGNLWIGNVSDCLNRYNREYDNFTRFKVPPRFGVKEIYRIYNFNEEALLLSTLSKVLVYDLQKDVFRDYLWQKGDLGKFNGPIIYVVMPSSYNKNIYYLTIEAGNLFELNCTDHSIRKLANFNTGKKRNNLFSIMDIIEDKNDSDVLYLIEYSHRIITYNKRTGAYSIHTNPHLKSIISTLPVVVINDAEWLNDDIYALGMSAGLYYFNPETMELFPFRDIIGGQKTISYDFVNILFNEDNTILWVGTEGGGVNKILINQMHFYEYKSYIKEPEILYERSVFAIVGNVNSDLWFGTDNGLIRIFHNGTIQKTYYSKPEDSPNHDKYIFRSLLVDRNNNLWAGTDGQGLFRFNVHTSKFIRYSHEPQNARSISSDRIRSLYETKNGTILVGTYGGGINVYNNKSESFTAFRIEPLDETRYEEDYIWGILQDSDSTVWLATSKGISSFDPVTGNLVNYDHDPYNLETISGNKTRCIFEDQDGFLWVGTYLGGLNKFDKKTKKFSCYMRKDGLPSNAVLGIIEDRDRYLWLSTIKGLSRFDPLARSNQLFKNYSVNQGLQSEVFNEGAYYKLSSGEIIFGNEKGVISFYPDRLKNPEKPPKIIFTDFKIFNKPVQYGPGSPLRKSILTAENIILSYKDNYFTIEFAALDYVNPSQNQYAFKLEGFNDDWIPNGFQSFASFSNIPPGDYTFRVKGANSDGIWNEKGISIKIQIKPPFWATHLFRFFVVMIIISVTVVIFRIRVHKVQRESKKLEKLVQIRTNELSVERANLAQINENIEFEISERKNIEDALRKSEEKYRSLLASMNEGFLVLDRAGDIIYLNDKLCELTGFTKNELLDRTFFTIVSDDNRQVFEEEWKKRNTGFKNQYETGIMTKSGVNVPVIVSPKVIYENGIFKEMYAVITDITERVALENKLKEYAKNLEQIVEQRTEQMLQSSKLASLGTFASGIAHQERQYLQTILLNTEMIKDDIEVLNKKSITEVLRESLNESIVQISQAVYSANALIKSLLGYSRGDVENIEMLFPKEQIELTINIIRNSFLKSGIILIEKLKDTPRIMGNPTQIREITMNLLTNARDSVQMSQKTEKRIEIHLFYEKPHITILVKDNGIGISPMERKQIFDPFFTTKSLQKGTGIGLSLVSKYVANHNGNIELISKKDYGATFIITIPVSGKK